MNIIEFEDSQTIVLKADLLTSCENDQLVVTPKKSTCFKRLSWWLRCYPNGVKGEHKSYVSVYVVMSISGIQAKYIFTIDRSEIKKLGTGYFKDPMSHGVQRLARHAEIQSGSIIQNGEFIIRCKVSFKINLDKLPKNDFMAEDSCIVKFHRKTLNSSMMGQAIFTDRRIVDGIEWWVMCYPCGYDEAEKDNVTVLFYSTANAKMTFSCGMSIHGVLVQRVGTYKWKREFALGRAWFSHIQIQQADRKNDIIDLVCKVEITKLVQSDVSNLLPILSQTNPTTVVEEDALPIFDNINVDVNAELLNLCKAGHYFESPKKKTAYKNLTWWLRVYPNGDSVTSENYLGISIFTSIGGLDIKYCFTIDGLKVEINDKRSITDDSKKSNYHKLVSHYKLQSSNLAIQDGEFTIRCKIKFKIISPKPICETPNTTVDSCIVEFDCGFLESDETGQILKTNKTMGGVKWSAILWRKVCFPGYTDDRKCYVSVHFCVSEGSIKNFSCGMSIGGVIIQKSSDSQNAKTQSGGFGKWYTHKQCQLADHKKGIISLMCKIEIIKPVQPIPTYPMPLQAETDKTIDIQSAVSNGPLQKQCIKDSIEIIIWERQFNDNGQYVSTPKKFAEGSDKYEWQIICFPAGDNSRSKGYISLTVETFSTETKPVILKGVVKIRGTAFEKKFTEEDSEHTFSKLISHEHLGRIGGILNSRIKIVCDISFETLE